MIKGEEYTAGPAHGARVQKREGEKWTLILVRELRYSREKIWQALTEPAHLREWAPFDVDRNLGRIGTVKLTWTGTQKAIETKVTRAERLQVLEFGDHRWELEEIAGGTRLTLWSNIDRRFVAWGAAGWHIAFDVLDRLLGAKPIGRLAADDPARMAAWQRLVAEYGEQFGVKPSPAAPKS